MHQIGLYIDDIYEAKEESPFDFKRTYPRNDEGY